ncbi:hypothetical protein [Patulibacter sp.]|uniref:hypothetical protein n=1 Tax=Patulibacter sp. TaxID=1912859 RepID=UPI002722A27C|nr:hypothetical protein [Patulibacter sp.]MDO9409705.1 hypothetical protein [Patulibacter sp.]
MTRVSVGDTLRNRDGREFTVVGQDGRWILSAVDGMSSPERVSASRLRLEFDVNDATNPAPVADDAGAAGLSRYGAEFARAAVAASPYADLDAAWRESEEARRRASICEDDD